MKYNSSLLSYARSLSSAHTLLYFTEKEAAIHILLTATINFIAKDNMDKENVYKIKSENSNRGLSCVTLTAAVSTTGQSASELP